MLLIMYWVTKVLLVLLYLYDFYQFQKAKRVDPTIKLQFSMANKIEGVLFLGLTAVYVVLPRSADVNIQNLMVFSGAILFLLVYLQANRVVALGRHAIFAKQLCFNLADVSDVDWPKGVLRFKIRNVEFKIRVPMIDKTIFLQKTAGRVIRNHRRKKK